MGDPTALARQVCVHCVSRAIDVSTLCRSASGLDVCIEEKESCVSIPMADRSALLRKRSLVLSVYTRVEGVVRG